MILRMLLVKPYSTTEFFVCGMFMSLADNITGPGREKKTAMKKATIFLLLRSRSYALSLFVSLAEKTLSHFATIS